MLLTESASVEKKTCGIHIWFSAQHLMCTGTAKVTNKINLDKLELQILGRSNIKHQLSTFPLFSCQI